MELQAAVGILRRRWWVLLLSLVIGLGVSIGITLATPKEYRATARLFVSLPPSNNVQEAVQGFQLSQQLLASYARMANSQAAVLIMLDTLDRRVPANVIAKEVSAATIPQTVLIEVRARDRDPEVASQLANAGSEALKKLISQTQVSETKTVEAKIIDGAFAPRNPISPDPLRNLQVGALAGLALGIAAALALDTMDKTIRTATDAAEIFDAPFLGAVPRQRRLATNPLAALNPGSPTGEAYRVLRTAIRFRDASSPIRSVLVTSASAGDGKSTIASNLAITMAQDGARVILIDGDLRRTRLAEIFDMPTQAGLSDVLLGKVKLSDALVSWSRGLYILQVGKPGLNPSEALGSQAMVDLLNEAKSIADIVIIDAPPVLPVTDPAVLAALVDATVVVCRWGRTSMQAAAATRQMLHNVGADVIGVVLNAEGGRHGANYYRHYSARPAHRRRESVRTPADAAPVKENGAAASTSPTGARDRAGDDA